MPGILYGPGNFYEGTAAWTTDQINALFRTFDAVNATLDAKVAAAVAIEAAARTAGDAQAVKRTGGGKEAVVTIANAGAAATLDLAAGNEFHVLNPVAAGTCTLTLTGATAGVGCGCTVYFHQRSSGDSGLAFAGGTVVPMNDGDLPGPVLKPNGVSSYVLVTTDGGATIYASKAGDSETSTAPAVPDAPTAVVGTRGNGQVSVAFTPGASNGAAITGYTVTASPGGATATGSASPIVVTGLTNGTAYTFTVHATNSVGNSAESSPSAAVTPATVPGAPTGVSGTPGNTSASIAFTAPASNGGSAITGYTATLSPGGATFSAGSSPISATGLTNGTAYTATVHATNAVGSGAESSASSSFTPAAGPSVPGAPTIGTASGGNAQATVTWTAPGSNGGSAITGYRVTPYIAGVAQTPTTVGVVLTANITGLTNGTAYTFKVAAINAIGTGPDSAASNSVTPSGPFDFAGLFTKGAFNVDDITPVADGTAFGPWVDLSALATNFDYDPGYGIGTRPVYKTNIAGGGTKPVLRSIHPNGYTRILPATIPQPFTMLWVGRIVVGGCVLVFNDSGNVMLRLGGSLTDYIRMYAGNQSGGPCADLSIGFHYVLAVFDGASSVLRVDGTAITFDSGSPGANPLQNNTFLPGDTGHGTAGGDPDLRAYGVAPIHPSSGQITAIESFAAGLL